jgi:RND superfamily putative drug exporter
VPVTGADPARRTVPPAKESAVATLLYRLGALSFRRRWTVLAAWLVLVGILVGGYVAIGGKFDNQFTIPGYESQQALDSLKTTMPAIAGSTAQIVFVVPEGKKVTDPQLAGLIKQAVGQAATAPQVATAVDPFTSRAVSPDGRTAIAQVLYPVQRTLLHDDTLSTLEKVATQAARCRSGSSSAATPTAPPASRSTARSR